MNRLLAIHRLGILALICTVALASGAAAASWTDFTDAQFTGIALDKPLKVNVLDYTLSISDKPTMTVGSKTYQINWVQSLYLRSGIPGGTFTATNGIGNMWGWDSKTSGGGQISGWTGQGNNRMYPGKSAAFHLGNFDPAGNPVTVALHVSYTDGQNVVTGWYNFLSPVKPSSIVPEPSSLICFGVAFVGFFGVAFGRRSRINS